MRLYPPWRIMFIKWKPFRSSTVAWAWRNRYSQECFLSVLSDSPCPILKLKNPATIIHALVAFLLRLLYCALQRAAPDYYMERQAENAAAQLFFRNDLEGTEEGTLQWHSINYSGYPYISKHKFKVSILIFKVWLQSAHFQMSPFIP